MNSFAIGRGSLKNFRCRCFTVFILGRATLLQLSQVPWSATLFAGINFSDHRSYWAHDWPAMMITDTAFFRNLEYHKEGDTANRLDYRKMADVVSGVILSVEKMSCDE